MELGDSITGSQLVTLEGPYERLYFLAKGGRMHRSKLMAWWRRGWIELETESTAAEGRKRVWNVTPSGQEAVNGAAM